MRPRDLPAWAQVGSLDSDLGFLQKCNTLLIDLISLHLGDPYGSLRVARCDPCAKVIELGVVDHALMIGIDHGNSFTIRLATFHQVGARFGAIVHSQLRCRHASGSSWKTSYTWGLHV